MLLLIFNKNVYLFIRENTLKIVQERDDMAQKADQLRRDQEATFERAIMAEVRLIFLPLWRRWSIEAKLTSIENLNRKKQ